MTAAVALAVSLAFVATTASAAPADSTARPAPPATKTGKERLGAKWADEQRVDDCGVPAEKRNPARARPDCDEKEPDGAR